MKIEKLKNYTLLYAEDEIEIRSSYANHFKKIFKKLYLAGDGREALALYKENSPDILLLDINMPYIDGLTLVQTIRELDKEVKIIMLTAHLDEEKLLKAIPLGLSNYLKKPVKKRALETALLDSIISIEKKNKDIIELSEKTTWDKDKSILIRDEEAIHLTKNEMILMRIFTSESQLDYSLDDIIEMFWIDYSIDGISLDSIRNIIKRLRKKLPEDSILNVHGIGYKLKIQN